MRLTSVFALASSLLISASAFAADDYPQHPDSKKQEGVPQGELIKFSFEKSKIFPGTVRDVTIYVPKQYDGKTPACVYVNQDGVQWGAPTVFDNLIHQKDMPVTIGVFVVHGRVKAPGTNALDRFNRSYEYDGLGGDYAKFILDELLPDVETRKTADGRAIVLSKNGNDRAIGGSSSGAVCAFTAAWERSDAFSRVFSTIGTYVGLRGADEYPILVRKFEPKPLRVFLQDGSNDLNIYGGDWWMSIPSYGGRAGTTASMVPQCFRTPCVICGRAGRNR
jgi:gluconolactonase